jgi:hypothetical protein
LEKKATRVLGLLLEKPNISYRRFIGKLEDLFGLKNLNQNMEKCALEIDNMFQRHVELAHNLTLKSTPVFFVDARKVPSFSDKSVLLKYIRYLIYLKNKSSNPC